jgi:hypothetical protein
MSNPMNQSRGSGALTSALVLGLSLTTFAFGLGCGGEQQTPEAEAPAAALAPAPAPAVPSAARTSPPAPEIPSNLTVDEKDEAGNPVRFSGTDPQGNAFSASIGEKASVPESLGDLPQYPGSQPMASLTAAGEGAMATFRSDSDQQTIYQFYVDELGAIGWEIGNERSFGGQRSFEALKASRKVSVTITGTAGDSRISIISTDEG